MSLRSIKALMVPLAEYATVSEDATLQEAFAVLEKATEKLQPGRHPHRAVLVLSRKGRVLGKIGMLDVLQGLEPKYQELVDRRGLAHLGFTSHFIKAMLDHHNLWDQPLGDICRKASWKRVRDFMYVPEETEYIDIDASLDEAIHHLVMGHHQALLVRQSGEVKGILRLSDVFDEVAATIRACAAKSA